MRSQYCDKHKRAVKKQNGCILSGMGVQQVLGLRRRPTAVRGYVAMSHKFTFATLKHILFLLYSVFKF